MTARDALSYDAVAAALARHGLAARGGFRIGDDPADCAHAAFPDGSGRNARTIIMAGVEGRGLWPKIVDDPVFSEMIAAGVEHPLDRWSKAVLTPLAQQFGGAAVFPNDQPYRPFQAWAMRADNVAPSPIGLLIHPEFGLWHAYRAALLFAEEFALPMRKDLPSPCESCADRPCLSACPVSAFGEPQGAFATYDVQACAGHLSSDAGTTCLGEGCAARNACPVGVAHRYSAEQVRFHMRAFARARSVSEERLNNQRQLDAFE